MEGKIFKTGDIAPVSGNYRFWKHENDVKDCVPRYGAYLHLIKGMKLPLHDDCQHSCLYRLMTITNEESEPKILGI
jgi:hypothetical protein